MDDHFIACDLGAESGRMLLGTLTGGRLTAKEIHRFPNRPIEKDRSLFWDIEALLLEVKSGLRKAGRLGVPVQSVSCDSWGVDYILFDRAGSPLEPTYHYRDLRTARGVDTVLARISWPAIYQETGIQFMALNTLFQLGAEPRARLDTAATILGIGDGFNYLLGGEPKIEVSMASTFQLYDPRNKAWSGRIMDVMEWPRQLFPEIVPSGTVTGVLTEDLGRQSGFGRPKIVASCTHDTAAAVAAVPAGKSRWAYLSSGTWSLLGVELAEPLISGPARDLNFTNEIGFGGSVRFLKNIIGLWLVQECRRFWEAQGTRYDYGELARLASKAKPFASLIDPADARFVPPGEMPMRIQNFCRETHQELPNDPGAVIRCVLESLALLYRSSIQQIQALVGWEVERLHIVGGGSQNALLNQFSANALGIPVTAGPVEATAIGNLLIQAIALGKLDSVDRAREVVRDSFPVTHFEPRESAPWNQAAARFEVLRSRS